MDTLSMTVYILLPLLLLTIVGFGIYQVYFVKGPSDIDWGPDGNVKEERIISTLISHYTHMIRQNNIAFWFAILSSSVGFILLISITVYFVVKGNKLTGLESFLTYFSGMIIEVVSVLFIKNYRSTRDALHENVTSLRSHSLIQGMTRGQDKLREEVVRKLEGLT